MKWRRSSADSFNAADSDMNTIWPNKALVLTAGGCDEKVED
jgi:hypothetical protein